jgi:tetratricopeptide (TPR) repeat protein
MTSDGIMADSGVYANILSYLQRGDYLKVVDLVNGQLPSSPTDSNLFSIKAMALYKLSKHKEAEMVIAEVYNFLDRQNALYNHFKFCESVGDFDHASRLLVQLAAINNTPESYARLIQRISKVKDADFIHEALSTKIGVLAKKPAILQVYTETLLYTKYTKLLNKCSQMLLKFDKDNVVALVGRGLYLLRKRKLVEAKIYMDRALKIQPDLGHALDAKSEIHFLEGDFEEANKLWSWLKNQDKSEDVILMYNYFFNSLIYGVEEWDKFINKKYKLDDPYQFILAQYSLIKAYQQGDIERFDEIIDRIKNIESIQLVSKERIVMLHELLSNEQVKKMYFAASGFIMFLMNLKDSQAVCNKINKKNSKHKVLHIFGDSHCIGQCRNSLKYRSETHTTRVHFFHGCKSYSLGIPAWQVFIRRYAKEIFTKRIQVVPNNSTAIFIIGEIDLRIGEGIFKVLREGSMKAPEAIEITVAGYIGWLKDQAKIKNIDVIVCGIHAPSKKLINNCELSAAEIDMYLNLNRDYNLKLKQAVKQAGFKFLDMYAMTVGDDLMAKDGYHIDWYHLNPKYLQIAIDKFLE